MARKLRVEYLGAIYHVLNRGDRWELIFKDDADRQRFVATLGEACAKTGWQVHAYVPMPNHSHLVVETPRANLVAGMKWLLGTYTCRFNRRHKLSGHLFSGRYKSLTRFRPGSWPVSRAVRNMELSMNRRGGNARAASGVRVNSPRSARLSTMRSSAVGRSERNKPLSMNLGSGPESLWDSADEFRKALELYCARSQIELSQD